MKSDLTKKLAGLVIGFGLGAIVWFLVYVAIGLLMALFGTHSAHFRAPLALVVAPIFGAIYGWRLGPEVFDGNEWLSSDLKLHWSRSAVFRAFILGPVIWIALVLAFISLFEPSPFTNGLSYLRSGQMTLLLKILMFPPLAAAGLYWAGKLIRGKK